VLIDFLIIVGRRGEVGLGRCILEPYVQSVTPTSVSMHGIPPSSDFVPLDTCYKL